MRRVFISFLGTNNYLQTHYQIGETTSKLVRFIQEALTDYFCTDWQEPDKIYIFYTQGSYTTNWVDNGQSRELENKEIESKGLEGILKSKPYGALVEGVEIDDGFSEDGMWKIFDKVMSKLEPQDEVYLDVTHAFRSIPMFSTVLFNFSELMNNTKLVAVHYGAFEKLGPAYLVKGISPDQRVAPVIDMKEIMQLNQYTSAVSSLVKFGRIGDIGKVLLEDKNVSDDIQDLADYIKELDQYISAVRMNDIKRGAAVKKIHDALVHLRKKKLRPAVKSMLWKLQGELKDFVMSDSMDNIAAAVRWAFKYGMYSQAYTLGQEYLVTLCADKCPYENPFVAVTSQKNKQKQRLREFFKGVLFIGQEEIDSQNFKDELAFFPDFTVKVYQLEYVQKLKPYYEVIRMNRNELNHAKNGKTCEKLIEEFEPNYNACLEILNS